ncbi:MAG TPA: GIY-YIG nuclease family protein, partial [Caldilineae bacterium]|nr:GIY-YIG nuclease family protein [Caldilineae bacterium]
MQQKHYYVYIIANKHHTVFYTGMTNDLVRRIHEHRTKAIKGFTQRYNIYKLLYYEEYDSPIDAIQREKQIKKYRREKKKALINGLNPEWQDLY